MKKVFLALLILLFLCSCSNKNIEIDDYTWKLESAYNENGDSLNFDEVILKAEKGKLLISHGEAYYDGRYYNAKKDPRSVIYEIEIEDKKGLASSSYTYYENEENKETLVINISGYSMYFCKAS